MAKITALACSQPPEGRAKWSLRLLADRVIELDIVETISHVSVRNILKKRTQASLKETVVHWNHNRRISLADGTGSGHL